MSELILRESALTDWEALRKQAEVLVKSKFLPKAIETPEQVMAIILTGRELGIGDMAALRGIDIIQGTPTIKPQAMLALIYKTRELEDIAISDNGQACTVMMKRRGRRPQTATFSMKDAQAMRATEMVNGEKKSIPLSEKYNWKQQPAIMRQWRAIAACARKAFPDVILGLYTPDEMGGGDDEPVEGEVIEEAQTPVEQPAEVKTAEPEPLTVEETPAVDKGKQLDAWKAGRRMAMRIITASTALKSQGVSEDTLRSWLPSDFSSRKDLTEQYALEYVYNLNMRLRLILLCKELAAMGATGAEMNERLPEGVKLMRDLSFQQVTQVYKEFTRWLELLRSDALNEAVAEEDEFIN
jgi:hypothetical protein